ncbi:MAG: 6-phosphofructokinase [Lachnospiraceae bacterium]|nr:6-phosphofructokinase [Lachnospiraceae bacterium]
MKRGNIVIGQSGGPTAVINSSLAGAIKAAHAAGIKIYGMHHGIEGLLKEDIVDLSDSFSDMLDLSLLKRTPGSFLGTCRYKLPDPHKEPEVFEKIFGILDKNNIDFFLYIGGNDSMDTIAKLSDFGKLHNRRQRFIGIPKTIDNDLPITDHCPGYGSAAKFVATSMKELIRDNESYGASKPRIAVVEIMGRNAGWLTAAAALSRDADCNGPDIICCPEIPFEFEPFLARVSEIVKTKNSVVIAVSEGLRLADGTAVCELGNNVSPTDAFGHRQLSGCARVIANEIGSKLGYDTRAIDFSVLQRCASHMASRFDLDEAYNVGYIGVQKALEGQNGLMVCMDVHSREPYVVTYEMVDVHFVANIEKKMPVDWITEDHFSVTQDFIDYVSPFVIGIITPYYAAGVPKHMTLASQLKK